MTGEGVRNRMDKKSARDIEGEWDESAFSSGLIDRCRAAWQTPISELSDRTLATFLRQGIALEAVIPEARRRTENASRDGTELYEGELREGLERALSPDHGRNDGRG